MLRVEPAGAGEEVGAEAGGPVDGAADERGKEVVLAAAGAAPAPGVVQGQQAEHDGQAYGLRVVESVGERSARVHTYIYLRTESRRMNLRLRRLTLRGEAIAGCTDGSHRNRRWGLRRGGPEHQC